MLLAVILVSGLGGYVISATMPNQPFSTKLLLAAAWGVVVGSVFVWLS